MRIRNLTVPLQTVPPAHRLALNRPRQRDKSSNTPRSPERVLKEPRRLTRAGKHDDDTARWARCPDDHYLHLLQPANPFAATTRHHVPALYG